MFFGNGVYWRCKPFAHKGMTALKRTLIEFYDHNYLENTIALFGAHYDAVKYLYLSEQNEPSERDRARLTRFVRERFGMEPEYIELPENTVEAMMDCFAAIVYDGGHCDFDITGGSPMFGAAIGLFVGSGCEEFVSILHYDVCEGRLVFCWPDGAETRAEHSKMCFTIPEIIALNEGAFLPGIGPVRYDLEKNGLRGEIIRLWDAVRNSLRGWNSFCALPSPDFMRPGEARMGRVVKLERAEVYENIAQRLRSAGIIGNEWKKRGRDSLTATFDLNVPENARFLYDKGGNLLEMVSYLAAVESGSFADCCTGATLDWNGSNARRGNEPYNEIDLVLTHGQIPVFVSCKSTQVENEYLYEIVTMARHFGGPCARPVLISSVRNRRSIKNRAAEMGVLLLDDVSGLGIDGLTDELRRHFPPKC